MPTEGDRPAEGVDYSLRPCSCPGGGCGERPPRAGGASWPVLKSRTRRRRIAASLFQRELGAGREVRPVLETAHRNLPGGAGSAGLVSQGESALRVTRAGTAGGYHSLISFTCTVGNNEASVGLWREKWDTVQPFTMILGKPQAKWEGLAKSYVKQLIICRA